MRLFWQLGHSGDRADLWHLDILFIILSILLQRRHDLKGAWKWLLSLLYRACHIEGVSPSIRHGKLLIGVDGGLALSHIDSKATTFIWGCSGCNPDLIASL